MNEMNRSLEQDDYNTFVIPPGPVVAKLDCINRLIRRFRT